MKIKGLSFALLLAMVEKRDYLILLTVGSKENPGKEI